MGGPCKVLRPVPKENRVGQFIGPACTDNFQIVQPSFAYAGLQWHSAEQAYQALKFPEDSATRTSIHAMAPGADETDFQYGVRVWKRGQSRDESIRSDWDQVSVKTMFLVNLAKYATEPEFQQTLLETEPHPLQGPSSTWEWAKWNGLIQTLIRKLVAERRDLQQTLAHYELASPADLLRNLEALASD